MLITIHRRGHRALFVRAGASLAQVPLEALQWLGTAESSADEELEESTPLLGLSPAAILYDITVHGYCALDLPHKSALAPPADSMPTW